jgi:hypothetical protein
MTLDELAARGAPDAPAGTVPGWALGCFHRRSITFFTGATDRDTRVYWLQAHGLTADLRIPAGRPRVAIAAATPEQLSALAAVEGGLAHTEWDGQQMRWSGWTSFQLHDKWPEPGLLFRVGDSLLERAPSGSYVEDWRLQPGGDGPLVGLELIEERALDTGELLHAGGGLVVCGTHAALVRGRPASLATAGRLDEFVAANRHDARALAAVFACDASYAIRPVADGEFIVMASTDPGREGQPLPIVGGWEADGGLVVQRLTEAGRPRERRFRVDTLEPSFSPVMTTPATAEAQAWLAREASTLLATAKMPVP